MSSPLRSCEEDEGMVVNSEGGDFDEEDDDDGDLDENASDINSPAAPRETATPAAPGTVKQERGEEKKKNWRTSRERAFRNKKHTYKRVKCGERARRSPQFVTPGLELVPVRFGTVGERRGRVEYARPEYNLKVEVFP